jgi:hypothetical protein
LADLATVQMHAIQTSGEPGSWRLDFS